MVTSLLSIQNSKPVLDQEEIYKHMLSKVPSQYTNIKYKYKYI